MPSGPVHDAFPSPNQSSVVLSEDCLGRPILRLQNASLESPVMILPGVSAAEMTKKGNSRKTTAIGMASDRAGCSVRERISSMQPDDVKQAGLKIGLKNLVQMLFLLRFLFNFIQIIFN